MTEVLRPAIAYLLDMLFETRCFPEIVEVSNW